jgi:hypothetical protein
VRPFKAIAAMPLNPVIGAGHEIPQDFKQFKDPHPVIKVPVAS